MPGKSKKRKAAERREQAKKDADLKMLNKSINEEIPVQYGCVTDYKVLSGSLHQGDIRFEFPGVQCTYISLWALISMKIKNPHIWNSNDVDSCIMEGNNRFLSYCIEEKFQPKMLLVKELPRVVNGNDCTFACLQLDDNVIVGTLSQPVSNATAFLTESISDAIVKGFEISDSCLLVCGGQTVALAKREDIFFLFDPHSRGGDGFLHQAGAAVLISFTEIQYLVSFIERLWLHSLLLKPSEQFELVPVTVVELNNDSEDKPLDEPSKIKDETDQQVYVFNDRQKIHDNSCMEKTQEKSGMSKSNRTEYMRQYMQKRRESASFRERDKPAARERMRTKRETEKGKQLNRERACGGMKKMLSTEKGRKKHNEQSAKTMRKMMNTEEGRQKHNERSAEGMRKMMNTEEGRQKHNERSAETMRKIMNTEEGRQRHNEMSAETMRKMMNTEEGRQRHNEMSAETMRKMMNTEEGRQKHNERSAEGMKKIINTAKGRQKHNERSAEGMQKLRKSEKIRLANRKRAAAGMETLRGQKEYIEKELIQRKRRKLGVSFEEAIEKFKETEGSCSYVCSSCHQVWFKKSVKEVSSLGKVSLDKTLLNQCITGHISVANREWICNTCIFNIKQGKIPKLSVFNGMVFPQKPPELDLSNLEERLISLRIPFMQIRALNSGGQFSLKGSVVNVPAEIEPTIRALPRLKHQSETIPVKLKRMKELKHAVITENVRPHAVMTALQTLLDTSDLYKEANISIDNDWNLNESSGDNADALLENEEESGTESDNFSEIGDDDTAPLMTLLDDQCPDRNEYVSVAPGEGQIPISIFKDPNAEYLSFPTLFCGQKRVENSERCVPVYYSDICKWELRSLDRRVALHIPNIFYKMKKLQTEQVCSEIHLAVRRCKTKQKGYTAGYILKDNMGESLVRLDEGYRIFKTIRNSPQYWETQKRDVFAMIRQLGLPTLFLSLSANDLYWPELIITLGKLVDKKDYSAAVRENSLSWETRSRLVQSDPVTCVRHFDHRVSQFIETILKSPQSPLGVLEDYFFRVEFQQRGSPHIHMLAWTNGSPKYAENDDSDVLEYIDQVASCSADVPNELEKMLEFQKHKHSRTCRKGGKPICRFGIPFPPMRKTTIVQPYNGEDRAIYEDHYKTVYEYLSKLEKRCGLRPFFRGTGIK